MSVVDDVGKIAELIKKIGDMELYKKILDLETEVRELTRDKRRSDDKVEELERTLKIKGELVFRENHYYLKNDEKEDGPFCSSCWDRDGKLIRIHNTVYGINCPVCAKERLTAKRK